MTTQLTIDSEGHLCLTGKALRAADHFPVSRYYDYTQVAYHKTVVGLEQFPAARNHLNRDVPSESNL